MTEKGCNGSGQRARLAIHGSCLALALLISCGKQIDPKAVEVVEARRKAAEAVTPKPEAASSIAKPESPVRSLSLVDNKFEWEYGPGYPHIVGRVTNQSDEHISAAAIYFNIYDNTDAQIGSASDGIRNIEPHGVWRFRVLVTQKNVASAKFVDLRQRR